MPHTQIIRITFKQILACIFLSVRVNSKRTFQQEIPCTCSSDKTLSLPSYTGSALKREQNSCNGYLSLLYFCLNAIELSPRNVICRLSISILYIFLYITKAKFFLVSNFFMNRFPSLSAFNWASRPHQPAIYSLFWVKNLEVA